MIDSNLMMLCCLIVNDLRVNECRILLKFETVEILFISYIITNLVYINASDYQCIIVNVSTTFK
jgi:hypothetical protein